MATRVKDMSTTNVTKDYRELTLEVVGVGHLLCASPRATHRRVYSPSPITAQSDIEYDLVIMERTANVAFIVVREDCSRWTPSIRIRITVGNIIWNGTPGEKPDLNGVFFPGMRIDTPSIQIELVSIGIVILGDVSTPSVVTVAALTSGAYEMPREIKVLVESAYIASMSSNLVLSLFIHALWNGR